MKKIISLILSICLILSMCPLNVLADEPQRKYLKISMDGKTETYECLYDNEKVFCSIQDLANISKYTLVQIDEQLEFDLFREHKNENGNDAIELKTEVCVKVKPNQKEAEIEAMKEKYTVDCYVKEESIFLPIEKLLYLLHVEWEIYDDTLYVEPMSFTILDFLAIHYIDLVQIASRPEDTLIDTGWLFSDNEYMQYLYSSIAEVFNDFDGKVFLLWWPDEGNVKTAEGYEDAILQLAKNDDEFIGKDVQEDALHLIADTAFTFGSDYLNPIDNITGFTENINDVIESVPDAVDIIEKIPGLNVSKRAKSISKKIENGEIDLSFLNSNEFESKIDISDGLAILQCVWNAYETADRVSGWNEEYLEQLDILANSKKPDYINSGVKKYIEGAAKRLMDSYHEPTKAAIDEAMQSTISLGLNTIFNESPFGKAFSILGAVGAFYGTFDTKSAEAYDVYSELFTVTFSIKIEQLVLELFKYNDILTTTDKLTIESINDARNQLMLYLRLNLRNKAQLYNLNIKGNKDKNWVNSQQAVDLHNEIVKTYAMLAELIETKYYDYRIVLDTDIEDIHFSDIQSILQNDKPITFDSIFNDFPQSFTFTSGVGAWDTSFSLEKDGSFTGGYCDSNYSETYICNFKGKFSNLLKIDEFTYSMDLESIDCIEEPGEIYYENNMKYITSSPYGLEHADKLMLYLPGRNTSDLPEEFLSWVKIAGDVSNLLPFYGIYNVTEKYGFFSDDYSITNMEQNKENPQMIDNVPIEISNYLDSNPQELIEIFNMQQNTPWQFGEGAESYLYEDFAVEWNNNGYTDYTMTSAGLALNTEADDGTVYNISLYGIMLGMTGEEVQNKLAENGYIFLGYNPSYTMQSYAKNEHGKKYGIQMQFYENQLSSWYWCNWREGEDLPDIDPYTINNINE